MSKTRDDERLAKLQSMRADDSAAIQRELKSLERRVDELLATAKAGKPVCVAALKAQEDSATDDTAKQADKPVFWQN